jgi:hypothetical protein
MSSSQLPFASIPLAKRHYEQLFKPIKNVCVIVSYMRYEHRPLVFEQLTAFKLSKESILQANKQYCAIVVYFENEYSDCDKVHDSSYWGEHPGITRLLGYIPTSVLHRRLVFKSDEIEVPVDQCQKQVSHNLSKSKASQKQVNFNLCQY